MSCGDSAFTSLRNHHTGFHAGRAPFSIPTSSAQAFPFLYVLANTCCFLIFLIGAILRGMREDVHILKLIAKVLSRKAMLCTLTNTDQAAFPPSL